MRKTSPVCRLKKRREWYAKNHTAARRRNRQSEIKRLYGLTIESHDFLTIIHQNKCAICGGSNKGKHLEIDHNHVTSQIRGMICGVCNRALGLFKVDKGLHLITNALSYLQGDR